MTGQNPNDRLDAALTAKQHRDTAAALRAAARDARRRAAGAAPGAEKDALWDEADHLEWTARHHEQAALRVRAAVGS